MKDRRGLQCVVFVESPQAALLRPAVEQLGGRVVKSDATLLMATFAGAGAALDLIATALGDPLARAGADTGDVSHESGDLFGMTIHIAKRLCERAEPGRALVSAHTAQLARAHDVPATVGLDLRGVGDPVDAVEVGPGTVSGSAEPLRAVVVTDLVGSTTMRSDLGDAASDELRRDHFRSLEVLADGHRGSVLHTTGDGLVIEFGSVVEAAGAALAFQRAVERQGRVRIRVGLDLGKAGAARLCDAAPVGGLLVGDLAAVLLRAHREFALAPAEQGHALQGGPQAMALPLPLPLALTGTQRGEFIGRDEEVEGVRSGLENAHAGQGLLVLLAGEAGIGKSRLAREAVVRAHDDGATVLLGRCDEQPLTQYQPFVEVLAHYVESAPIDDLSLRARGLPELALLVPRLPERLPGLEPRTSDNPEEDRFRLFEAVVGLLEGLARDTPLVLLLEDLHWADSSTLQLLRHLSRSATGSGLAVLGTYRTSEVGRRHPLSILVGELRERGLVERLDLRGLPADAVSRLIEKRSPGVAAGAVLSRTDGNPFFVLEMLRHVEETGDVHAVPTGVRDVVARRLLRLSDATRRLLTVGGVAGREFDRTLVERAASLDALDALDALEEAVAAEVLVAVPGSPGRYRFTHALTHDAVVDDLGEDRRAMIHLRLGLTLEAYRPEAHLTDLSRHFAGAGPAGDAAKAAEYATRAGDQALAVLAHEEAALQYERALTALGWSPPADQELRMELLLKLAAARIAAGNRSGAREAATQAATLARAAGNATALARAALWAEGGWVPVGATDPLTVELLEEAAAALGADQNAQRARVLAAHAMQNYYLDMTSAIGSSAEAVALARRAGDDAALGRALHAQHYTLRGRPEFLSQRLAITEELLALALRRGDREQEGLARLWSAADSIEAGDLAAFDVELEKLRAAARELRRPLYAYWAIRLQGMRALMVGDFELGERLLPELLETGERADEPNTMPQWLVQRAVIAHAKGGAAALADEIQVLGTRPRVGWAAIVAWLRIAAGEEERAGAALDSIAAGEFAAVPDDAFAPMVFAHCAEVVAALDRVDVAPLVAARLAAIGEGTVMTPTATSYVGPLPFFRGLLDATLGHFDRALAEYERATAMARTVQARPLLKRIADARERALAAI